VLYGYGINGKRFLSSSVFPIPDFICDMKKVDPIILENGTNIPVISIDEMMGMEHDIDLLVSITKAELGGGQSIADMIARAFPTPKNQIHVYYTTNHWDLFTLVKIDDTQKKWYRTRQLFHDQFKRGGTLDRVDIIIRYMVLEEFDGKSVNGINFYERFFAYLGHIKGIDLSGKVKKFKHLFKIINENGFDKDCEISISNDRDIKDGTHRFVIALYNDIEWIPWIRQETKRILFYDYAFISNIFSPIELEIIKEKERSLLQMIIKG